MTVNDRSFDTIVRDATAGVSRRRSLFVMGSAGVVAALAGPYAADAKKASSGTAEGKKGGSATAEGKKRGKQRKKCPPDRCAGQVDSCTITLANLCGGEPSCQDSVACCSHFATCDATGFWTCFVASVGN
jgi:hypothetical protein